MIVDLLATTGTNVVVDTFTLSEITQRMGADDEIVDVSIHGEMVQILTTSSLLVFKPQISG
jgi:hypothetical protein